MDIMKQRTLYSGLLEPCQGIFNERFVSDWQETLWTGIIAVITGEWNEARWGISGRNEENKLQTRFQSQQKGLRGIPW